MCERSSTLKIGDCLAVKGARVSEFGGKSLNAADDHSVLFTNTNHERCRALKLWYENLIESGGEDPLACITSLTMKANKGEGGQHGSPSEHQMRERYGGPGQSNGQNGDKPTRNSNLNLICEINESLCDENDTD